MKLLNSCSPYLLWDYKAATYKLSEENKFWRKTIHSDCWGHCNYSSGTSLHCVVKAGRKLKWENQSTVCSDEPWFMFQKDTHHHYVRRSHYLAPVPSVSPFICWWCLLEVINLANILSVHTCWSYKNAHIRLQWVTDWTPGDQLMNGTYISFVITMIFTLLYQYNL